MGVSMLRHSILYILITLLLIALTQCGSDDSASTATASASATASAMCNTTFTCASDKYLCELNECSATAGSTLEFGMVTQTITTVDSSGNTSDASVTLRSFGGQVPGPLLTVTPGETVNINLSNVMEANPDEDSYTNGNCPHEINNVNFHMHGFHVDPTGTGDNVLRIVGPSISASVNTTVPSNHNPGTHWYHPHVHGADWSAFVSGVAGMFIIKGGIDDVAPFNAMETHELILQKLEVDSSGTVPYPTNASNCPAQPFGDLSTTYTTVNAKVNPYIKMAPNEVQRWRFLNATLNSEINLSFSNNMAFKVVAMDGITQYDADANGATGTAIKENLTSWRMANGNRVDFIITAPGTEGTYTFRDSGTTVLTIEVDSSYTAESTTAVTATHLNGHTYPEASSILEDYGISTNATIVPNYAGYSNSSNKNERTIEFSGGGGAFKVGGDTTQNVYHDNCNSSNTTQTCADHIIDLNELHEWTVKGGGHPFHIHVNSFKVIDHEEKAGNWSEYYGQYVDTMMINSNTTGMKIRFKTDTFVGMFVHHCHKIDHQDQGMMQSVAIVNESNAGQTANSSLHLATPDQKDYVYSASDYPGSYVTNKFYQATNSFD
jgi:FtsP/CotA-like multicopper oxidase with cupredoxin domain